ncbi:MAG: nucleoside-binding protein [Gemmatimonadota bacterium]|nr:nucleoside-binding protein [Gemmatimonadota bacterium]
MKVLFAGIAAIMLLAAPAPAFAQTEFHLQYGSHLNPFSGSDHWTLVFTVQNASVWKLGDSFFFLDYIDDSGSDGFNDRDFYSEWYPTLSFGKLAKKEVRAGPIRDFAMVAGVNAGGDAKVLKYLPGVRASWSVPGFLFLNTDLTAYIDDNTGADGGGAPKTGNSFMFDVSWLLPIEAGGQSFTFTGHAEYIGGRSNEFGDDVRGSILAQPQLVWDVGMAMAGDPNQFMVGVEFQYWRNKLGTDEDEIIAQMLVVWRM